MKTEIFRFLLRPLSPIHIGCDEVFEPTGFAVDGNKGCLMAFDPLRFISGLDPNDKAKFSSICKKGTLESMLELYRFLRNRPVQGRPVIICRDFVTHYNQVLSLTGDKIRQELNRFTIERTAFLPGDNRPYIPGSAVKGALRTAYLNMLANNGPDLSSYLQKPRPRKGSRGKDIRHKKLEQKLLALDSVAPKEMMSKDPFRLVKVSDFMPVGDAPTKIYYAVNKKKKLSEKRPRGPYQILETVMPGALFKGEIRVDIPREEEDAVTLHILPQELLGSLNTFFNKEKSREDRELENIGIPAVQAVGDGSTSIIRLGRHSGAESVTIRKYRDIKIKLGNKRQTFQDHATTLWAASDFRNPKSNESLFPFGWAAMASLTSEEESGLLEKEAAFQNRRRRELQMMKDKQRALDLEKERERKLEQEKKRRKEEERKEAEKRKVELEAMTPEERALFDLEDSSIGENRLYEIYRDLDGFGDENKEKAAQLLKYRWQNIDKWNKRNCSKKQWQKVQHIKAILGEK